MSMPLEDLFEYDGNAYEFTVAVLPTAVGPNRTSVLFESVLNLLVENLSHRQRYYLAVVLLDLRGLEDGQLVGAPVDGYGEFVGVAVVLEKIL